MVQCHGYDRAVRAALQHAVDNDLRVTVRGGGHCYENFVSGNDGGVIIDLTPMHGVYRDEAAGAYVIEGGCTLWNVYWNLYRRYGCQVNAVAPGETAVPQRSSIMKLQYQTYWTDPADDEVNLAWIRGLYERMYGPRGPLPDAIMDGCYVNYPDVDLEDWQCLYYKDDYARLQAVKGRWDPLDVFHHEQSIELP